MTMKPTNQILKQPDKTPIGEQATAQTFFNDCQPPLPDCAQYSTPVTKLS